MCALAKISVSAFVSRTRVCDHVQRSNANYLFITNFSLIFFNDLNVCCHKPRHVCEIIFGKNMYLIIDFYSNILQLAHLRFIFRFFMNFLNFCAAFGNKSRNILMFLLLIHIPDDVGFKSCLPFFHDVFMGFLVHCKLQSLSSSKTRFLPLNVSHSHNFQNK